MTHSAASDLTRWSQLVFGIICMVMIANLLIMVIVGGYETFVSRMNQRLGGSATSSGGSTSEPAVGSPAWHTAR